MMKKGFTLVELLVVVSIIGILIGITLLGLQGARESARDTKRKSDLEYVRAGLELFKADCKKYPLTAGLNMNTALTLAGDGSNSTCLAANLYLNQIPKDANTPTRGYRYYSAAGVTYEICASLEDPGLPTVTCGGSSTCGNSLCNLKVTNP